MHISLKITCLVLLCCAAELGGGRSNAEENVPELFKVNGRILDAVSARPIPGRVHVLGSDKTWHLVESSGGSAVQYDRRQASLPHSPEVHTTLSAHPFTVSLLPGEYTFRVERGKEYLPVIKQLTVARDPVNVDFRLKRWVNMAERGWYSGDTHVHRTIDELPNVLIAEDLNVALPLTYWVTKSNTPPNRGDRNSNETVRDDLIEVDATHVIYPTNTEYEIFSVGPQRHTLGAVFILNHKTPFPMGVPPVAPIAEMARSEGAILDFDKHSWPWSLMIVPIMGVDLFELTNNHIWQTGFGFNNWTVNMIPGYMNIERFDDGVGVTEWGWLDFGFKTYYALLNTGFRMRVSGGTASGVHPVQLGFGRVYVHLPNGFNYADWMAGLNAGRSFVSTGPMLEARFNNQDPGHTFTPDSADPFSLSIRATATSRRPLEKIEIIINGDTGRLVAPTNRQMKNGGYESLIDETLTFNSSAWVAIRCFEDDPNDRHRFAHTNPVFVDIAGKPLLPKKVEIQYFIDRMTDELRRNRTVLSPAALLEYQTALGIYEELRQSAK